jgi:hypothetical protein
MAVIVGDRGRGRLMMGRANMVMNIEPPEIERLQSPSMRDMDVAIGPYAPDMDVPLGGIGHADAPQKRHKQRKPPPHLLAV